jgi:hypothetical protein
MDFAHWGHPGKICRSDIRHTKHTIGDSSTGSGKAFSGALFKSWHKTYTSAASLIFARSVHGRQLRAGKKRGLAVGKTKRRKGTKIMAIADTSGLPVAAHIESAFCTLGIPT